MTLWTAHRILIGAAIAFFVFYGFWELGGASGTGGGTGGIVRGGASLLAAGGLGVYLWRLRNQEGTPE
jgi:hypothetical protein